MLVKDQVLVGWLGGSHIRVFSRGVAGLSYKPVGVRAQLSTYVIGQFGWPSSVASRAACCLQKRTVTSSEDNVGFHTDGVEVQSSPVCRLPVAPPLARVVVEARGAQKGGETRRPSRSGPVPSGVIGGESLLRRDKTVHGSPFASSNYGPGSCRCL